MRQILNFFMMGLVLLVATLLFPEYVVIEGLSLAGGLTLVGLRNLVLTTLLIWLIATMMALLAMLMLAVLMYFGIEMHEWLWIVLTILMVSAVIIMSVFAVSALLPAFEVVGLVPTILISVCLSAVCTEVKPNDK